jgi:hypothetical protein
MLAGLIWIVVFIILVTVHQRRGERFEASR